jgi:phosphotransacetylase
MKTVIYSEGEDERVLRATQVVLEERLAKPILIGRPDVIRERIKRFGLTIHAGQDFEVVDPSNDPRYRDYVATYLKVAERKGVTPDVARIVVRSSPSVIGALALHRGEADALICGLEGRFTSRLDHIRDIIGLAPGVKDFSALSLVIAQAGVYFLADTHVRYDPSAEEIADTAIACAHHVRRFGIAPKIALISHSDFGSAETPSALKMREALRLIEERAPDLEVDGEMPLTAAHDIAGNLERSIRVEFGEDVEVDTHIEPLEPELPHGTDASADRVEAIKAALSGFAANGAIHDIHNVRVRDTDAGEIVNFHCRAAPSMSVIKVHECVDEIERSLRRAFPTIKRVISHAEPPRIRN